MTIFLLLLLQACSLVDHEVQVAFYKFNIESSVIKVEIVIENAAWQEVAQQLSPSVNDKALFSYLDEHLSVDINNIQSPVSYTSVTPRAKHLVVSGVITDSPETVTQIQIVNTCLLELDDQSNIVEITLDDNQRDFLMNKNRQTINLKYD